MSSKQLKKRISYCKEKSEVILNILNGKKSNVDINEFINTIKFVINVLEDFLKNKKYRPTILDEGILLENLIKEYEELLKQLINSGKFLRFFTSTRVRKKIDQINAQLHQECSKIFLGIQENKKKKSKSTNKKLKTNLEIEKEKYTENIKDEEGKIFWEKNFPEV